MHNMKKLVSCILWLLFAAYLLLLFYLLFVRNRVEWDISYSEYINTSVNLIPFRTIGEYIAHFFDHTLSRSNVIMNLAGNVAALFPMGIFLPCVSSKFRSAWRIAVTVFVLIFICECIQLFLRVGSFDIDDLILNILGALLAYGIWKLKPVNAALRKLYLIL